MIKASLLLAAMFGLRGVLARRSAAERHAMWAMALALGALLPIFSATLPSWQPDIVRRAVSVLPSFSQGSLPLVSDDSSDIVVRADGVEGDGFSLTLLLSMLWIGGTVMALLMSLVAWRRLAKYRARAATIDDADWLTMAADIADAMGVSRPILLLTSGEHAVPVTWGWLHPRILLPAAAAEWGPERRRVVLAHEIAHVRRADCLVQIVGKAICAIYWFNPLFWMAYDQLCRESEQASDDAVLRLGVDREVYATHLFAIVRSLSNDPELAPALSMASRCSNLERRFAALLNARANRRVPTRRRVGVTAAIALTGVIPLAAMALPGAHASIQIKTGGLPALPNPAVTHGTPPVVGMIHDVRSVDGTRKGEHVLTAPSVAEYSSPPLYSDEARRRRIEGVVTLDLHIDRDGQAEVLRVVKGLGYGLDENATLAVRRWQFQPALENGTAVESTTSLDVMFSLANEEINELIANDMATRVGPGVTPPRVVRSVAVEHDRRAAGPIANGSVLLDIVLLEDGTPKVVRITRSLDPVLDHEAARAFEQWQFTPAVRDGRPIKVRLNAEVTFHLK